MCRVEDLAEETRGVLAEDLEADAFVRPLDEVREFVAVLGEEVRELHELEVEVDERVLFLGDLVVDLPADVLEDDALPLGALFHEQLAGRIT